EAPRPCPARPRARRNLPPASHPRVSPPRLTPRLTLPSASYPPRSPRARRLPRRRPVPGTNGGAAAACAATAPTWSCCGTALPQCLLVLNLVLGRVLSRQHSALLGHAGGAVGAPTDGAGDGRDPESGV